MAWKISFTKNALKQLKKLDKPTARLIVGFLEEKIAGTSDARKYGHALIGDQKGRWRYRIGDYRVLWELRDKELLVVVITLGHRREIYR